MNSKFRNIRISPTFLLKSVLKLCYKFRGERPYRIEFVKDALQHLCGTASETAIFKENCLMNASIFCFQFKVVHCLSVSLTTDFHSKAIMDLSSVQFFSNIVSVTEGAGQRVLRVHSSWYFKFLRQCGKVIDQIT